MTYTELKTNIEDITENTFTDTQLDLFIKQAEETILTAIEIPALRKLDAAEASASLNVGEATLAMPTDYLRTISIAVKTTAGVVSHLIAKDNNFLQEAYPFTGDTEADVAKRGQPKYYAQYNQDTLAFAPIPDQAYELVHIYAAYPTSITEGTTSWLGDNASSLLLNAALVEAARFMKAEQDIQANYQQMYAMSLQLFKEKNDNSQYTDHYRSRGLVG
tara:strand:- start:27 stop:680 length:654 start_codon:yes stop_codon:yes gene_type:complete